MRIKMANKLDLHGGIISIFEKWGEFRGHETDFTLLLNPKICLFHYFAFEEVI